MHYSRRPSFRILQSAFRIALVALGAAGAATAVAQDGQYQYADLDGTAYFDTGYMVKDNSVFRFKMASRTSTVSYQSLFADYVDENTQATRVIVNQTSATDFYFNFRTKAGSASGASKVVSARGNPVEGVLSRSGAVLNGKSFTLNNVTAPASTATMKIGGKGSNANSATRFWYFIIEEDGVVLHHYVPWRDGAKVGIMDLKTGIFLENTSSGGTVTLAEFLDFDGLQVTGSPMGYGASVPAYGLISSLEPDTTYAFSAPAVWTNEAATAAATCQGFTLRLADGTTVTSSATQTNLTYSSELEGATLTWLWAPHKAITVSNFDEDLATVYINGRPVADGEKYFLAPGESTATLELRDFRSDWYFAYAPPSQTDRSLALDYWGGLPEGVASNQNPCTLTVESDLTVVPNVDCKGHVWHVEDDGTSMSNTVYKLGVYSFRPATRSVTPDAFKAYYAGDRVMDFAMRVRKDGVNYTVTTIQKTNGDPFKSSVMASMHVYNQAFTYKNYGLGQSEAVILFVVCAVVGVTQVLIGKRGEVEA